MVSVNYIMLKFQNDFLPSLTYGQIVKVLGTTIFTAKEEYACFSDLESRINDSLSLSFHGAICMTNVKQKVFEGKSIIYKKR